MSHDHEDRGIKASSEGNNARCTITCCRTTLQLPGKLRQEERNTGDSLGHGMIVPGEPSGFPGRYLELNISMGEQPCPSSSPHPSEAHSLHNDTHRGNHTNCWCHLCSTECALNVSNISGNGYLSGLHKITQHTFHKCGF